MKILITGANRGIGATLVEKAIAQGHEVVALARNLESLQQQWQDHSQVICDHLEVTEAMQWQQIVTSLFPTPGTPIYATSKFAVRGFSIAAAQRRLARQV